MSLKIVVLAKQVPDTRNVGKDAMKAFLGNQHIDDDKHCKTANVCKRNSGADHFIAK